MPYLIQTLIQDKARPVSVNPLTTAADALELMVENDYSQLLIIEGDCCLKEKHRLVGMVTTESILRAIRLFHLLPDQLTVVDCKVKPREYRINEELFSVIEGLKIQPVVVIIDSDECVVGILTDYDMAEYFRQRAEDAMLVEDIEALLRNLICLAFTNTLDENFNRAISVACAPPRERENLKSAITTYYAETDGKYQYNEVAFEKAFSKLFGKEKEQKTFDQLTLSEYTAMWLSNDRWDAYAKVIKIKVPSIRKILDDVRGIRNKIAHFKGNVNRNEHEKLLDCRSWMSAYLQLLMAEFGETEAAIEAQISGQASAVEQAVKQSDETASDAFQASDDSLAGSAERNIDVDRISKYSALKRWLSGVPSNIKTTWIDFEKVEKLIDESLPPSAFRHRAWWSNDRISHSHSKLWLEAGWETDVVDLENKRVRFRRTYQSTVTPAES